MNHDEHHELPVYNYLFLVDTEIVGFRTQTDETTGNMEYIPHTASFTLYFLFLVL